MSIQIKRTNHLALRPTKDNFQNTLHFYKEILGFSSREWSTILHGNPVNIAMLQGKDGLEIEVFDNGTSNDLKIGSIQHICFEVDDVKETMTELEKCGYLPKTPNGQQSSTPYNDITICEDPKMIWRTGFIMGPCGEMIEFFEDRT